MEKRERERERERCEIEASIRRNWTMLNAAMELYPAAPILIVADAQCTPGLRYDYLWRILPLCVSLFLWLSPASILSVFVWLAGRGNRSYAWAALKRSRIGRWRFFQEWLVSLFVDFTNERRRGKAGGTPASWMKRRKKKKEREREREGERGREKVRGTRGDKEKMGQVGRI